MSAREWRPDDRAYLVPTLPGAPSAAYQLPPVTVVALVGAVRLVVRLADGREIETDRANVRRTRPDPPERTPRPRARPVLPTGYDEQSLW